MDDGDRDWSAFACPNEKCVRYGKRGEGNIRPHGWSGKKRKVRCLRCVTCRTDFSERRGTPLFRVRLPEETYESVVKHVVEGTGMRATARLCEVTLNTVLRVAGRVGQHAEGFHDQQVRGVATREIQADEAWSFVGKKRKALRPKQSGRR